MTETIEINCDTMYASLTNAVQMEEFTLSPDMQQHCGIILKHSENSKAVLTVLITSLVKKIHDPEQDIRQHQKNMENGYSGRVLDTNYITPFLKKMNFPAMSKSGWLTRSLEQNRPYSLDYPGRITPEEVKQAFLKIIHEIQEGSANPEAILSKLFLGLKEQRDSRNVDIARPVGLTINSVIEKLDKHFFTGIQGTSRLPVLAIYAIYKVLVDEVARYKGKTLKPLESHTTADERSGALGDIEIANEDGSMFEVLEIKHNIHIDQDIIDTAYRKFSKHQLTRYYILSTKAVNGSVSLSIQQDIDRIKRAHGCQLIVNGVSPTVRYYLRLLEDTDLFIKHYAYLLEKDHAIKYEHREAWNKIFDDVKNERGQNDYK